MTCTTPVPFEKIVKRISHANSELVLKNTYERAFEMLKSITSDLCIEKNNDKIAIKAIHRGKTITIELQVEKSRINDLWLVTMTPYL